MPGTYSLSAYSPEELYVRKQIIDNTPDVIINVIDASNIERNLYLTTQLVDMNLKIVGALNMFDEFESRGDKLDYDKLGELFGMPFVPTVFKTGRGIDELFKTVINVYEGVTEPGKNNLRHIHLNHGKYIEQAIDDVKKEIQKNEQIRYKYSTRFLAIKLLEKDSKIETQVKDLPNGEDIIKIRDNAEFGYGMLLAQNAIRDGLKGKVEAVMAAEQATDEVKAACKEWLDTYGIGALNGAATDKLVEALDGIDCPNCKDIVKNKDFLAKKSQWVFGGDGWAYDLGFGGVDHVLASGKDINIMVFNTEVYSNTGGQSSKATPTGAVAQFAAGGKDVKKKDLASIAMSYGYVYVAQISMGADYNQTVKALAEAEAYPGPSLIIAYAPCINHGIKKGMDKAQTEEKLAVECGYWNNFRYNPAAEKKFSLDSKAPKMEGRSMMMFLTEKR